MLALVVLLRTPPASSRIDTRRVETDARRWLMFLNVPSSATGDDELRGNVTLCTLAERSPVEQLVRLGGAAPPSSGISPARLMTDPRLPRPITDARRESHVEARRDPGCSPLPNEASS